MIEVKDNELYFAKKVDTAIVPTRDSENAGMDIYAADRTKPIVVCPNTNTIVDTGIATAFTEDYFIKIFDKSGYGVRNILINAGVVDSGFRDSIKISLSNLNRHEYLIITPQSQDEIKDSTYFDLETMKFIQEIRSPYDERVIPIENCIVKDLNKAITQIVLLPVPKMDIKEISFEELQSIPSKRGTGWQGSSGK